MSTLSSDDLAAAIVLLQEDTRNMRRERGAYADPEYLAAYDQHIATNEARLAHFRDALGEVVAKEVRSRPRA